MDLSWMAWTWQTAMFFGFIAFLLIGMSIWEFIVPGGSPRHGILGLDTTRGDRLFVSLLTAAYIHLAWLAFAGSLPLIGASIVSIIVAIAIFRWV